MEPMIDEGSVPMFSPAALGRTAYEAYVQAAGGISLVSGDPLPVWSCLPPEIREAWAAAGSAVFTAVRSYRSIGM